MKDVLDIHRALLERQIPHETVRLARMVVAADEIPHALDVPPQRCLAVRMYAAPNAMIATVVQAGFVPAEHAVRAAAGAATLQPATPDLVNRVTDYAAELVAPLLLPPRVQVIMDRAILRGAGWTAGQAAGARHGLYTPTGDSGTAIGIHPRDLLDVSGAQLAELASTEIELHDIPGAVLPRPRLLDMATGAWPRG